jgi:hypothetical protein
VAAISFHARRVLAAADPPFAGGHRPASGGVAP